MVEVNKVDNIVEKLKHISTTELTFDYIQTNRSRENILAVLHSLNQNPKSNLCQIQYLEDVLRGLDTSREVLETVLRNRAH